MKVQSIGKSATKSEGLVVMLSITISTISAVACSQGYCIHLSHKLLRVFHAEPILKIMKQSLFFFQCLILSIIYLYASLSHLIMKAIPTNNATSNDFARIPAISISSGLSVGDNGGGRITEYV